MATYRKLPALLLVTANCYTSRLSVQSIPQLLLQLSSTGEIVRRHLSVHQEGVFTHSLQLVRAKFFNTPWSKGGAGWGKGGFSIYILFQAVLQREESVPITARLVFFFLQTISIISPGRVQPDITTYIKLETMK